MSRATLCETAWNGTLTYSPDHLTSRQRSTSCLTMPSNPPPPPVPAPPPPLTVSNTDGHAPAPALAALTRFPLHTPANASSPLITCSSSTGPLPNQTLLNLRTVLVASRFAAQSRVQLKLENHKLINERVRRDVVDREHATVAAAQAQAQAQAQAAAAAAAAQAAAAAESKRREEAEAKAQAEDSKRKREQQEQLERERVEQAARMAAKQEEEVFAATGQRNGQNDQENHPASSVDRQTRPVTGSTTDESVKDGDTSMRDGSVQAPLEGKFPRSLSPLGERRSKAHPHFLYQQSHHHQNLMMMS